MTQPESFKKHLSLLMASKEIDDSVFADVVYRAVSEGWIDVDKFREDFGLTQGAVERWMQGQNLPQLSIRGTIIAWMDENS